jgi:hypothetical protein
LAQAAGIIGSQPGALQLRYLQTLTEISVEKNSTIIFPLPMDIVAPILNALPKNDAQAPVRTEVPRERGPESYISGYQPQQNQ